MAVAGVSPAVAGNANNGAHRRFPVCVWVACPLPMCMGAPRRAARGVTHATVRSVRTQTHARTSLARIAAVLCSAIAAGERRRGVGSPCSAADARAMREQAQSTQERSAKRKGPHFSRRCLKSIQRCGVRKGSRPGSRT